MSIQSELKKITLELGGNTIEGEYRIYAGWIHVTSIYGSKSAQIRERSGFNIPLLAKSLLRELFQESK